MKRYVLALAATALLATAADARAEKGRNTAYDALVAKHAKANGVPESLVHRIIVRESRYNPRAVSRGNYGMMQIRLGTAKGMGYRGSASGLLDADTNLTYAVPYLANAFRVAGGNHNRAVALYAGGYYYAAKRKGILGSLRKSASPTIAVVNSGREEASAVATRSPVPAAPSVVDRSAR